MGIIAASQILIGLILGLVLVLVKLTRHFTSEQHFPLSAKWIDELSVERYRPMLRLLDRADLDFLRTQPGFTERMATGFRIQRCHTFQEYLRHLDNDFRRICTALALLIVQSQDDRPDLAVILLRNRMHFGSRMMLVKFQLMCYRFGIGTVDVTGLVRLFEGMRLDLRTLIPAES